jgi:hypothetical protein
MNSAAEAQAAAPIRPEAGENGLRSMLTAVLAGLLVIVVLAGFLVLLVLVSPSVGAAGGCGGG